MGICVTVDKHAGIAWFRYYGVVTPDNGHTAITRYVEHPDFDPSYIMIADSSAVTEVQVSFSEILFRVVGLSSQLRKFDKRVRCIFLATNDITFGTARILGSVLDTFTNIDLIVARNQDELWEAFENAPKPM